MTETLVEPVDALDDVSHDHLGAAGRLLFRQWVLVGFLCVLPVYAYVLFDLFSGAPYLNRATGPSGFYTYQASSLLHGHLWMRPSDLGVEAFLHGGHSYTYFGIFPSLLRLPFVALLGTHGNANYTAGSMFLAWVATGLFSALLIWRLRLLARGHAALGRLEAASYGVLVASILGGSVIVFLAASPWVYNEDFAWAIALSVGVFWSLLGVIDQPTWGRVAGAGALILAASLNRLTAGWACVIAALAVGAWFWLSKRHAGNRRWVLPVVAIGIIPLLVSCAINYAKFGLPFGLPMADQVWAHVNAHRRAFLAANGGKAFSFSFLPSTLNAYLNPLNLSVGPVWPYVQLPTTLPRIIGSATFDQTYPTASIPATMPLLFGLSVWGLVTTLRRRPPGRIAEVRFILIPAVIGCAGVLLWGYIANRYMADFMPLLIVASAVGLIDVARRLEGRGRALRRRCFATLVVLGALGVAVNAAVATTPSSSWSKGQLVNLMSYQKVFSKAALEHKVTITTHLPTWAPAGDLFATPTCSGLYRSNGESFVDVPGQQLEHLGMSPVIQGPQYVHDLWIRTRVPVARLRGDTTIFRMGPTRIVMRPVDRWAVGFFVVHPGRPDITWPGPGGGWYPLVPGRRYAVQVTADPNLGSIQVWWYNKRFKDLGIPMVDHLIVTRAPQHVVATPAAQRGTADVVVTPGPRVVPSTHLCRDLTGR